MIFYLYLKENNIKCLELKQLHLHNAFHFKMKCFCVCDVLLFHISFSRKRKFHCILLTILQQQQPHHSSHKRNAKNEASEMTNATVGKSWSDGFSFVHNIQSHTHKMMFVPFILCLFSTNVFLFYSEKAVAKRRMTHMKSPIQMWNTKQMSIKKSKKEGKTSLAVARSEYIQKRNEKQQPQSQIIAGACQIQIRFHTLAHTYTRATAAHHTWSRRVYLWSLCKCGCDCVVVCLMPLPKHKSSSSSFKLHSLIIDGCATRSFIRLHVNLNCNVYTHNTHNRKFDERIAWHTEWSWTETERSLSLSVCMLLARSLFPPQTPSAIVFKSICFIFSITFYCYYPIFVQKNKTETHTTQPPFVSPIAVSCTHFVWNLRNTRHSKCLYFHRCR